MKKEPYESISFLSSSEALASKAENKKKCLWNEIVQPFSIPLKFRDAFHQQSLCATVFSQNFKCHSLFGSFCVPPVSILGSRLTAAGVDNRNSTTNGEVDCQCQTVATRSVSDTRQGERWALRHFTVQQCHFGNTLWRKKTKRGTWLFTAIRPFLFSLHALLSFPSPFVRDC